MHSSPFVVSILRRATLTALSLAALSLAAGPVAAQDLKYTLNGVTFSDAASASGYFVYNPTTSTFGAFDITTTDGKTDAQQGVAYVSGTGFALHSTFVDPSNRQGNTFEFLPQGGRFGTLVLDIYDVPADTTTFSLIPGKIIETSNLFGSGEFTYPPGSTTASIRGITAGSLGVPGASPVPEASITVSLGLLLALGGLAVAVKRRKAVRLL